ncbi:MAG: hypothetical protein ABSA39_20160 [Edaphobacter sp.]
MVFDKRNKAISPPMVIALVFFCGCQKKAETKQVVQTFRAPSAAELFDLESKCNALGNKAMENNLIGSALTQSQLSHYNPADNRCYVLLNVSTADIGTPIEQFTSDYFLDDGQTGDILATRYCKGHNCTALVYDESLKNMVKNPSLPSEDEVRDLMDKFVHPDRRVQQGNTQ